MAALRELDRITIDLGTTQVLDIDSYLERQRDIVGETVYAQQVRRLKAVRRLVRCGLADDTPRVYGATDAEELLIFPHFKLRTADQMTWEQQTEHDQAILEGRHNKRVSDIARTGFGQLLSGNNADEVPFNMWIGTHGLFGNGRPPLVAEYFSDMYEKIAADHRMTPMESAQQLRVGIFTVSACYGARIMDEQGRSRFMEAISLPEEAWPPRRDMVRATLSSSFLSQTSNCGESERTFAPLPVIVG